jgi:hypothetical protein
MLSGVNPERSNKLHMEQRLMGAHQPRNMLNKLVMLLEGISSNPTILRTEVPKLATHSNNNMQGMDSKLTLIHKQQRDMHNKQRVTRLRNNTQLPLPLKERIPLRNPQPILPPWLRRPKLWLSLPKCILPLWLKFFLNKQ